LLAIPNRFSEAAMRRALLLVLALLIAAGGCANPRNPGLVVAHETGRKPSSKMILTDSIVELHAREQPTGNGPITSTGVISGTRIGFRANPDGSVVAFVGDRIVPIPEGRCEWVMVETCWPRWWSRRADDAERAAKATAEALTVTGIGIGAVTLGAAYIVADRRPG
jgi:hypothetical protein